MGNVKVRIWDVKHGNATFIRTPNNKNLVFDLGRGDYSENSDDRSPLETLRDHYRVRKIDYLMVTHPHKDHIDDILNLDYFDVSVFHRPKHLEKATVMSGIRNSDRLKFEKYFEMNERFNTPIVGTSDAIDVPENYGGVIFKHFSTPLLPQSNLNNHSLFTIIEYEKIKIIIPGDNECISIDQLMQRADFKIAIKDCDVLIAPHHGRESAYSSSFVDHANPRLTIISDGSVCDTSANSKYSARSRGWSVHKNGAIINRKLLTTNCDGEIYIDFGSEGTERYLRVEIK